MRYSTNQVSRRRRAVLVVLLAGAGVLAQAAVKGPDAGRYVATDAAVYSFVDVSGASGGVSVLAATDDGLAALTLPFPFEFYGRSYRTACASTNGALFFVPAADACTVAADFAHTDVTGTRTVNDWAAVLPFWSDLTFDQSGAGAVFYQTLGAAGARTFVVQWQNAFPQGSQFPVTFQVLLTEGSNAVRFQYKTVDLGSGNPASLGAQATVGIRNSGAPLNGQMLQWSFDAPVLADQTALLFSVSADSTPPDVTARVDQPALWPPNGRTVAVRVSGTIRDAGCGIDPASARFEVLDEYGELHPAGPVAMQADGSYAFTVALVASRAETDPDGRTYAVVVSARDLAGNASLARAVVTVPHDFGKRGPS